MPILLQINSIVNSRSTGRITEEIGETAISNGFMSYIAYGRDERISSSILLKIGTSLDIKLHGIKTRIFDLHGFGSKNATKVLIKKIETINPDIIHLHNIHGYYLNIELLFSYLSKANIAVVWTFHDCWPLTGHCAHFASIGCERWKIQCYDCPQRTEYPSSLIFDKSKKNYLKKKELFNSVKNMIIVPVSNWMSKIIEQSFLSAFPIHVINNGINLEIFKYKNNNEEIRLKYKIGNRYMLLSAATTWSEKKGLNDYLYLSKALSSDFVIVLVGLTKRQMKYLPDSIIGLSRTENISELVKLYSAADIVLNLSAEESFGLTTVEGFACGTPGIVYNCTASPELITASTGFVVDKGDIQSLVKAIQIIKSKGKSSYSLACRNYAERFYDKNNRYMEYIKLYKSLLQLPQK